MILQIIFCFISGLMAALGFGGGFFLLIYLTTIAGISQLEAQAINLFFFILVAVISIVFSIFNRLINFKVLGCFLIFGLVGVGVGLVLEFVIPVLLVRKMFAIFLFLVGLKELFLNTENTNKR